MALSKYIVLFCALTTYHNKNTRVQSMFYNLSSLRSKMFAEDNKQWCWWSLHQAPGHQLQRELLKAEAGHQQAAAPLPPNKSVLIISTSARLGINRHSAYQHSYQHAANQEHCTRTCTWLSIFNVVIKVAQSCVAVNICNTQGSRITHTHTHIVWLSVWLYLSGLLPGTPH